MSWGTRKLVCHRCAVRLRSVCGGLRNHWKYSMKGEHKGGARWHSLPAVRRTRSPDGNGPWRRFASQADAVRKIPALDQPSISGLINESRDGRRRSTVAVSVRGDHKAAITSVMTWRPWRRGHPRPPRRKTPPHRRRRAPCPTRRRAGRKARWRGVPSTTLRSSWPHLHLARRSI